MLSEIKAALSNLTSDEKADLASSLGKVIEPVGLPVVLPDYAARRRAIYGDRVLPVNAVLEARESEAT